MSPDLGMYEHAATAACYDLCESPYEQLQDEDGRLHPRWMFYARDMKKLRVMIQAMQMQGLLP